MLLTILIILTILLLTIFVVGVIKGNEDAKCVADMLMLFLILFGYGIIGLSTDVKTIRTPVVVSAIQDENSVHLSYNGTIVKTFRDIVSHKFLSDKGRLEVIKVVKYNMYGGAVFTDWELPNKQQ